MSLQTRYVPLPIIARHKLTGETCRVCFVSIGDNCCGEGNLVLEHVNGNKTTWELFSTLNVPSFNSRNWKIEFMYENWEPVATQEELLKITEEGSR